VTAILVAVETAGPGRQRQDKNAAVGVVCGGRTDGIRARLLETQAGSCRGSTRSSSCLAPCKCQRRPKLDPWGHPRSVSRAVDSKGVLEMAGGLEVLEGVLVPGLLTAPDVPTDQTFVAPASCRQGDALLAHLRGWLDVVDHVQMAARPSGELAGPGSTQERHSSAGGLLPWPPPNLPLPMPGRLSLAQVLVDEADGDRAFPDRRGDPLGRPVADVPDREHAGQTGLQRRRWPLQRPAGRWPAIGE
jgi:hypothetical protein